MQSKTTAPGADILPDEHAEAMEALEQAVATLWREYDGAVNMLMLIVDLFDEAQQEGHTINVPNLRKAMGKKMRASIKARDDVLAALGIEPDDESQS